MRNAELRSINKLRQVRGGVRVAFIGLTRKSNAIMPVPIKEKVLQDCPIRNILSRICDKWSMLVLYTLKDGGGEPTRFNELRRKIPDISQKMLASTLRTLEADGYVERRVYAEVPPRVEYSLTPRSLSLIPLIENLIDWAADNMAVIMKERGERGEAQAECAKG